MANRSRRLEEADSRDGRRNHPPRYLGGYQSTGLPSTLSAPPIQRPHFWPCYGLIYSKTTQSSLTTKTTHAYQTQNSSLQTQTPRPARPIAFRMDGDVAIFWRAGGHCPVDGGLFQRATVGQGRDQQLLNQQNHETH